MARSNNADSGTPESLEPPELFERVAAACRERVLPLVTADAGELYLVSVTVDEVHVHLAGTCAGCPGAVLTERHLIAPVVNEALPSATLRVTTGWRTPSGAQRLS